MGEAVETVLQALALWRGHGGNTPQNSQWIDSALVQANLLPPESLSLITALRIDDEVDRHPPDESRAHELLEQGDSLFARAASLLESAKGN